MNKATPRARRGGSPEALHERAGETRSALLQTARRLFAQAGYHETRTDRLTAAAQLTEGSLYHHFRGKKGLFEAVFRSLMEEARDYANATAIGSSNELWSRVIVSFETYLAQVGDSEEFRRIVLIDGPVVFGWPEWLDLQTEYIAASIADPVSRLMDEGVISRLPPKALASLLQSALNHAALAIAHASEPERTRAEMIETFLALFEGLRVRK